MSGASVLVLSGGFLEFSRIINAANESHRMGTVFKFYVGQDEIYSGELREVPERYGATMKEDITNWADSLSKGGLNELVYSHLAWYEGKDVFCTSCDYRGDGREAGCPECGAELRYEYHYERNPKLDLIMDCIGMITRIEVIA